MLTNTEMLHALFPGVVRGVAIHVHVPDIM